MTRSIHTAKTSEEILSAVKNAAEEIFPVIDGDIFIIDWKSGDLLSLTRESDYQFSHKIWEYLEEGVIDWVLNNQYPAVIEDLITAESETYTNREGSLIFIPLLLQDGVRGVIALYTPKPKHTFTSKDFEMLSTAGEEVKKALDSIIFRQKQNT